MISRSTIRRGLSNFLIRQVHGYLQGMQGTRTRLGDLRAGNLLQPIDIAEYAYLAGFQGDDLPTAVAIALAESRGNPTAYNPESQAGAPPGMGSYGLWQIYLNAHPEFAGWNLYDPQTNAQAAYSVFANAGGFRPWATFLHGQYRQYLDTASAAISPGPSSAWPAGDVSASTQTPWADRTSAAVSSATQQPEIIMPDGSIVDAQGNVTRPSDLTLAPAYRPPLPQSTPPGIVVAAGVGVFLLVDFLMSQKR